MLNTPWLHSFRSGCGSTSFLRFGTLSKLGFEKEAQRKAIILWVPLFGHVPRGPVWCLVRPNVPQSRCTVNRIRKSILMVGFNAAYLGVPPNRHSRNPARNTYTHTHIYIHMYIVCTYIYIYVYIQMCVIRVTNCTQTWISSASCR